MKKNLALCCVAILTIIISNTLVAQNIIEDNTLASKYTEKLSRQVKLNKTQLKQVFQVYKMHIAKKRSLDEHKVDDKETIELVNYNTNKKLKAVLNEEQYQKYLAITEE